MTAPTEELPRCKRSGKFCFPTKQKAWAVIENLASRYRQRRGAARVRRKQPPGVNGERGVYRCEFCKTYHISEHTGGQSE